MRPSSHPHRHDSSSRSTPSHVSPTLTPSSEDEIADHAEESEAVTEDKTYAGESYQLRPLAPRKGASTSASASASRSGRSGARGEDDGDEELGEDDGEDTTFLRGERRMSVGSAQSYELYTPDEERAVVRKLDRRLVLFMAMLYCLSFLDRSNIGNARIAGLQIDLHLSSKQYSWLLWAFYITYIVFEWMTLMYRIFPPHIYISICILSWGIIASLQAISTSFGFLLVLRALLGVGEAAFGPGVPFYLSFFFRRNELAFRTGLFISASPLSASFAGALAWVITKLGEGGPLAPWRLLFLIEGFPSVLVAVWAWDFIPDSPSTAKFLSPRLREVAVLRLRQEKEAEDEEEEDYDGEKQEQQEHGNGKPRSRGIDFREILRTLKDPKCYLTAAMFFSCNVAFSSMPVFLPTILRDMNHTSLTAQALSAPPYLFAFLTVLLTAHLSDHHGSRSIPLILHSLLASLSYLLIALCGYFRSPNTVLRYAALFPATAGFFSAITLIITWTLNNQEGDTAKGAGMAVLNVIGQMGPLVGTSIFPEEDGPWYVRGMAICAAFMLLVGVLAGILRVVLSAQNRRARNGKETRYQGVAVDEGGGNRGEKKAFEFML
ncbi:major facilitator superfamily domain-containing protein [Clohesyomyces aquaticus]|uniref:Major facilitator superfamily domain-containing protein n=1 Tax=Clohesyomyces aquaticus TaxID=1231657 RepID=A0A1Y1YCP1_9PLEO|nr:major facilitator superfamily domain-containing protein [Clohesyomyces aquaticus]